MRERRSNLTPAYTWSDVSQRYRNQATGKWVSRDQVRAALDIALDRSRNEVTRLSRQLVNGGMSIGEWQLAVSSEIKNMHLASASLAKGGWAQMTQSDFGRVGQIVRGEYAFLANFAAQIKSGEQRLDGSLISRANLYAQAPRGTFHAVQERAMSGAGFSECRNVLSAGESCEGCIAETAKGWTAIGMIKQIGTRTCLANCRCVIQFRKGRVL